MHEDLKHFNHAAASLGLLRCPKRLTREDTSNRDTEEVDAILALSPSLRHSPQRRSSAAVSNRRRLYQSENEVAAAEAELYDAREQGGELAQKAENEGADSCVL